MSGCCPTKNAQRLEDYFENESNKCEKKKEGHCWWSPLFIIDYVVAVVLLLLVLLVKLTVEPNRMYVPTVNITTAVLDSQGIAHNVVQTIDIAQDRQYPAVKETLPTALAGVIFGVVCVICWVVAQVVLRALASRKWNVLHDMHNTVLGIVESLAVELIIIEILKRFAGRYRPRYLAIAAEAGSNVREEWEGRVSYPSGHTGTAFSSMFFCTLYLLGKTRAYSSSSRFGGGSAGRFAAVVLSALPTFGAFLVAITRTRDYMHNFSDINGGAIIGLLASTLAYFTVFPALTHPECQLPRIRLGKSTTTENVKSQHEDNEEEMEVVVVNTDDDVDGATKQE